MIIFIYTAMGTPTYIQYNEHELIAFLQQKDKAVFNYLYENYSPNLFATINKIVKDYHTSEDVLQNVFVKIWNKIDQFDPAKGTLFTWMLNIAVNSAIDMLRSKGEIMKQKLQPEERVAHLPATNTRAGDGIGLKSMILKLKPECQKIISMVYFEGYTIVEVADILNVPVGTIKTRIRSSLMKLKANFAYVHEEFATGAMQIAM